MSNPDTIVDYVKALDARHDALRQAIAEHKSSKVYAAIPGSIDNFDRALWKALDADYETDDE